MTTRPARTRPEILSDIQQARSRLAQLELELASLAFSASSRNSLPSSPVSPAVCTLPVPNLWTPAELEIDLTRIPRLPVLPSNSVNQVFLHKSGAGNRPEEALLYESTSYKPLEFFGDAVVEYEVSRLLRKRFPLAGPGVLTVRSSALTRLTIDRNALMIDWGCRNVASSSEISRQSHFGNSWMGNRYRSLRSFRQRITVCWRSGTKLSTGYRR